ncbi:kinase-like protein [Ascoidea rubescens DSM 1968]|uniref:Kinase-like protein n=1 Tax=Ascoidea rubescens DSM 1968 TaxID=1344418 RepID=A0A1D2V847_9ASCO|nr:kinase-like protein [Ascoidea rubescens DSM 1968]ODV57799.1 kinase-like protein [Ascoidea rubescens DSM 1968]
MREVEIVGDRVIKCTTLQEARNLEYVQNKVSCPKIYDYYTKDSKFYIEMEYIAGKTLYDILPELSEEQKQTVTDNIVNELNKLKEETSNEICGIDGTTIYGPLIDHMKFESEREFNKHISSYLKIDPRLVRFGELVLPTDSIICLRHGDLNCHNIIVKDDMSVVLIDWEYMAFLPEYWDLMKLFLVGPMDNEAPMLVFNTSVNKKALLIYTLIINFMYG